jgi:hypothetical protein
MGRPRTQNRSISIASQPAGKNHRRLGPGLRLALAGLQARHAQQQAAQEAAHVGEERPSARLFGKAVGAIFEDLAEPPALELGVAFVEQLQGQARSPARAAQAP